MRIVFINPRSKNPGEIQQKVFAPVSLLYLSSCLLGQGHEVEMVEANALGLPDKEVAERIRRIRPDLIGLPVFSEISFQTCALARRIKEVYPEAKIVLGGPHVNALAEKVLGEVPEADYVLRGESEESITLLCRALENKLDKKLVPGLCFRKEGAVVCNPAPVPVRELDGLRPPARELLGDIYRRRKYYMILERHRPVETVITSRGCPFQCRFCCNRSAEYRARSPENILEELVSIYARGIRNIDIADANFTFDRGRAQRIFQLIRQEKLNISFRFKGRADSMDEELAKDARSAGAYLVSLGMESGSAQVLRRMEKNASIERNVSACSAVMKQGLKLNTGWIIGFPGETEGTVRQTVDLILKIKPTTANINALVPYPGTEVYEEAKAEGNLEGDWSAQSPSIPWVKLPWIKSCADLQRVVQWAKNKIYYRPYYIGNFTKEVLGNLNMTLAKYAFQEMLKSLKRTQK